MLADVLIGHSTRLQPGENILIESFDVLLVDPAYLPSAGERARLLAKVRERKVSFISLSPLAGSTEQIEITGLGWSGTDHGRGSCLFVLGNSVDGGKIHGTVPVLATENLADGRDLPVTTDFRSVFSEIAGKHLNIKPEDDAKLFPGWTGQRLPLIKS